MWWTGLKLLLLERGVRQCPCKATIALNMNIFGFGEEGSSATVQGGDMLNNCQVYKVTVFTDDI